MTDFAKQIISPYNPKNSGGGAPPLAGFTAVVAGEGGKPSWQTPEFARFKVIINYRSGFNRKGYSTYYSIDYDDKTKVYNEMLAYSRLEKMIKSLTPEDYRLATIFANFTSDLSTRSRNYNYQIAIIRGGKYTFLKELKYFYLPGPVVGGRQRNHTKVDIQETLKNFA